MTTIRQVMTQRPACVAPDATLQAAAGLMADQDVGFVPIQTTDGRLLGIITDRDIVTRAIARHVDPLTAKVSDYMTAEVEFVGPETGIDEAVLLMESRKIRRLPVCENGQLVGVVSLGDLAECEPEAAEAVLVEVSKSPRTLAHKAP